MKKYFITLILISIIGYVTAQNHYTSFRLEAIISDVLIDNNGQSVNTNARFSGFLNIESNIHFDFTKSFGLFTGYSFRNIGLIITENDKTKYRSYSFGIPVSFKYGQLEENRFFYAGANYELLFHYKEKVFVGNKKTKSTEWLSDKTNLLLPSVFAGIQMANGINIQCKLYLDNFFNQNYTESINNVSSKPYQNLTSQLFYVAISYSFTDQQIKENLQKPREFFVSK